MDDGKTYPVRLDIIEWRSTTNRALYLCNAKGFPLTKIERRFHIGAFQFSAYVKSEYISKLQKEGMLEFAEINPLLVAVADRTKPPILCQAAGGFWKLEPGLLPAKILAFNPGEPGSSFAVSVAFDHPHFAKK